MTHVLPVLEPSDNAAVIPAPGVTGFADLGLPPALQHTLTRLGYAQPTPIQAATIPAALAGRDVLGRAETGTGKTAAFALPTIARLLASRDAASRPRGPRSLVLVPTRELAVQVERAMARYGAAARMRTLAIFGGVSMGPQLQALRQRPDIVIATPGRLIDHLQRGTVDLSAVEILTLDEADRMLDLGFLPALRRVLAALPKDRQTLLFSATLPREVLALAADMTREPQHVDVGVRIVAATVTHQVHAVADHRKADLLAHVLTLSPAGQALVFCRTKRGADRVGRHLGGLAVRAEVIHGNKSQSARTRALDGFRSGRVRVLVATDIAARGLDIAQLPLVVNYDLPMVAEDYVHRIGRTGRAGVAGRAVSLVTSDDRDMLAQIQRLVRADIERITIDGFGGATLDAPAREARPVRAPGRPARRPWRGTRRFAPRRSHARA